MEESVGHWRSPPAVHRRTYLSAGPDRILPADRSELCDARLDVAMIWIPPFALEISVVCVGIFLLMMDCFSKTDKISLGWAAIAGLLAILALSFLTGPMPKSIIPPDFYLVDQPALFFKRFILLSTVLTICLGIEYAPVYEQFIPSATPQAGLGEFLTLPVFTCAGLMWMVSAADFIMIFVSLELVTVSFYVLVASMRKHTASLEAGVKYLILGALSTGFIVYGITWIFGVTGQTSLREIRQALPLLSQGYLVAVLFGLGLVLVSLGFKIAAVPFQFWVPDVYQGAPTPITAFLSVASKAAGFIVLLRVLEPFFVISSIEAKLLIALTALAACTLIYGNLAAMPQTNLKRLLGYSSIAHAGYLLIGVASFEHGHSGPVIGFYLAGYLLMTFLAFLVLQHVAQRIRERRNFRLQWSGQKVAALGLRNVDLNAFPGGPALHRRLPGKVFHF